MPKIGTKEAKQGKPFGPQLAWLPGGRLQVTMFRMAAPAKPGAVPALHRGWQKITVVRTGKIKDVPAADVPSQPRSTQGHGWPGRSKAPAPTGWA